MSFGLKGVFRTWGPSLVKVSGSFLINVGNVVVTRPARSGVTVKRQTNGVYTLALAQSFQSVVDADAELVTVSPSATTALSTLVSVGVVQASGDFVTANTVNYVADNTNKNLLLTCFTSANTLGDPTNAYRISYTFTLAESSMNK